MPIIKVAVVADDFKQLANKLKNPEEMMRDIEKIRRTSFYNSIATNKDAQGKRVKPLSPTYADRKRSKYGQRNIRVASGDLIASYDSEVIGNKLREFLKSPYAIYVDANRQLLPRTWEEIPNKEKILIQAAMTDFVGDILDKLVRKER